MDMARNTLIGIGEVAELLNYSASNVRRLERTGDLPVAMRVSGRRVFLRSDVEIFAEKQESRRDGRRSEEGGQAA